MTQLHGIEDVAVVRHDGLSRLSRVMNCEESRLESKARHFRANPDGRHLEYLAFGRVKGPACGTAWIYIAEHPGVSARPFKVKAQARSREMASTNSSQRWRQRRTFQG